MGFRMLLLDIDGTLRPMDSPVIPKENVHALEALQMYGIQIAVATGRCRSAVPEEMLNGVHPNYWICGAGAQVLIHVGMDTVELNGEGFKPMAKEGDKVKKGQLLLKFDMKLISGKGYKLVTPMIVTNADEVGDPVAAPCGEVKAGDAVITYGK